LLGTYDAADTNGGIGIESGGVSGDFLNESQAVVRQWLLGSPSAGTPTVTARSQYGTDVLVQARIQTQVGGGNGSGITFRVARPGSLGWDFLSAVLIGNEIRRVALCATGPCKAQLDWVRMYDWPAATVDGFSAIGIQNAPMTGARLFVP
jgi:hypothetical protein